MSGFARHRSFSFVCKIKAVIKIVMSEAKENK
jgi:hypothetical protein